MMRKSSRYVVAMIALLTACVVPPVEQVTTTVEQVTSVETAQALRDKVDILFMVDNSSSMGAMQKALQTKFSSFLNVFYNLAHPMDGSMPQYADLQIAVVTSDYGAGDAGEPDGCGVYGTGQSGNFQEMPASSDIPTGITCGAPMGATYIKYAFAETGDVCNLPGGCNQTALNDQFTCMASVGSGGCGFEHQLESVYAALNGALKGDANHAGFLRDGAILAVVFVTNEDDGSAPASSDFYNPAMGDEKMYGLYTTYRQTHFGVACGTPPKLTPEADSGGALDNCEPASNLPGNMVGEEFDVSRYIDFFTTPGTLRPNPTTDIILVAIDAPETPFEIIQAAYDTGNGKPGSATYTTPCTGALGDQGPCIIALQHSCQNSADQAFFGDPPIRLNTVIRAAKQNDIEDICGDDNSTEPDYTNALEKVAGLIVSALKPSCLQAPINNVTVNGVTQPDCVVEDVNGTTRTPIPFCGAGVMACATNPAADCWIETTSNTMCPTLCQPGTGGATGTLVQPNIQICRHATPPANTSASISCSTIALADEKPCDACKVPTNTDGYSCDVSGTTTSDMKTGDMN